MHLEGIKEMDGQGFKNKLRTFLDKHVSHHFFKRSNIQPPISVSVSIPILRWDQTAEGGSFVYYSTSGVSAGI